MIMLHNDPNTMSTCAGSTQLPKEAMTAQYMDPDTTSYPFYRVHVYFNDVAHRDIANSYAPIFSHSVEQTGAFFCLVYKGDKRAVYIPVGRIADVDCQWIENEEDDKAWKEYYDQT